MSEPRRLDAFAFWRDVVHHPPPSDDDPALHTITVYEVGHSVRQSRFRAVCSCREFVSSPSARHVAEAAGEAHRIRKGVEPAGTPAQRATSGSRCVCSQNAPNGPSGRRWVNLGCPIHGTETWSARP